MSASAWPSEREAKSRLSDHHQDRQLVEPTEYLIDLSRVAVTNSAKRGGLDQYLVKQFKAEGRRLGCQRLCLEVSPKHNTAIQLYRKLGFEELDRRETVCWLTSATLEYVHTIRSVA